MDRLKQIDIEIRDLEELRRNMLGTLYPQIVTQDIATLREEQLKLWKEKAKALEGLK